MLRTNNLCQITKDNQSYNNSVKQINKMQQQMKTELNSLYQNQSSLYRNFLAAYADFRQQYEVLEHYIGFLELLLARW